MKMLQISRIHDLVGLAAKWENTADAEYFVPQIDAALRQCRGWKRELLDMLDDLDARLKALPPKHREHVKEDGWKETKRLIRIGNPAVDGYPPEFVHLAESANLELTEKLIRQLRELRKPMQAHLKVWPTLDTTHRFRYIGQEGKHRMGDGRYLQPGDIVEFDQHQFDAVSDRFEPEDAPSQDEADEVDDAEDTQEPVATS